MAVTQGLGDGYALYNGVKLPNIESVWTEEVKAEKPYAFIYYGFASGSEYWLMVTDVPATIITNSQLQIGYTSQEYVYRDGKWTLINSGKVARSVYVDATTKPYITWVSQDITKSDSTVLFSATVPIPLDGMQVIEWDGDVTGLLNAGNYYLISEYADASSAIAALKTDKDLQIGQNLQKTDNRWTVDEVSEEGASSIDYVLADSRYGIGFYKDGTVYTTLLAYTPAAEPETPKWQFNLQDFLSGMASAAASRGVLRREPIAYLYNGVQLPGLPEWDKETYPYALIVVNPEPFAVVPYTKVLASKFPFVWMDYGFTAFANSSQTDSYVHSVINEGETEWSEVITVSQNGVSTNGEETVIWANHDILNEDGSLYLAASEPIPIYE